MRSIVNAIFSIISVVAIFAMYIAFFVAGAWLTVASYKFVESRFFSDEPQKNYTAKAEQNTLRNRFIAECVEMGNGATKEQCTCAMDVLDERYNGNFLTDKNIETITNEGYSYEDVEAITSRCNKQ